MLTSHVLLLRLRQEAPFHVSEHIFRGYAYKSGHIITPTLTRGAVLAAYIRHVCPRSSEHIRHLQSINTICTASVAKICSDCTNRSRCPVWLDIARQSISWHCTLPLAENDLTWIQKEFIGKHKLCGYYVLLKPKVVGEHILPLAHDLLVEGVKEPLILSLRDLLRVAQGETSPVKLYKPCLDIRTEVGLRKESSTSSPHMLFAYEVVTMYRIEQEVFIPETKTPLLCSEKSSSNVNNTVEYYTIVAIEDQVYEEFSRLLHLLRSEKVPICIGRGCTRGLGLLQLVDYHEVGVIRGMELELRLPYGLSDYLRYLETLVEKHNEKRKVLPLIADGLVAVLAKSIVETDVRKAYAELIVANLRKLGLEVENIDYTQLAASHVHSWSTSSRTRKYPAMGVTGCVYVNLKLCGLHPRDVAEKLLLLYLRGLQSADSTFMLVIPGMNIVKVPIIPV